VARAGAGGPLLRPSPPRAPTASAGPVPTAPAREPTDPARDMTLRVRLFSADGREAPRTIEVRGDVVTVGRGADNLVRLDQPTVSTQHLKILSGLVVADSGSLNGTFVGGERIKGAVVIEVGTVIELGGSGTRLMVEALEPSGSARGTSDAGREERSDGAESAPPVTTVVAALTHPATPQAAGSARTTEPTSTTVPAGQGGIDARLLHLAAERDQLRAELEAQRRAAEGLVEELRRRLTELTGAGQGEGEWSRRAGSVLSEYGPGPVRERLERAAQDATRRPLRSG
jgi:pSer/pThr/pTyr-binding forkhead associated (FHA) protein